MVDGTTHLSARRATQVSQRRPGQHGRCWPLTVALCLWPFQAFPQSSIPDPSSTPGALNPAVTQATISATICRAGYAAAIRPPEAETSALKRRQLRLAGMPEGSEDAYEEDHLVPLELGGAPADERNLWPQPRQPWLPSDGWDASRKDELEGVLRRQVCAGRLPLAEAQRVDRRGLARRLAQPGAGPATARSKGRLARILAWRRLLRVCGRRGGAFAHRGPGRFRTSHRHLRRWHEQLLASSPGHLQPPRRRLRLAIASLAGRT